LWEYSPKTGQVLKVENERILTGPKKAHQWEKQLLDELPDIFSRNRFFSVVSQQNGRIWSQAISILSLTHRCRLTIFLKTMPSFGEKYSIEILVERDI
jgi:hypothetical protein